MFFVYNTKRLFYERYKGSKETITFLHGWGCNSLTMKSLYNHFIKNDYDVVVVDFFGFGKSDMPDNKFTIYDYVDAILQLLNEEHIPSTHLICHSFGGRVGLILSANYPIIDKLVLLDSAGLKPRRGLLYYFRVYSYKLRKFLHLKNKGGSEDFKALPVCMQSVFINVVNTHLDNILCKIKNETLIIWGSHDNDTPLYMAKKLEENIINSGLIILEGGHFVFLDNYYAVVRILDSFFEVKNELHS